jgi:phosphoribosylamine--glycine ligase
MLRLQSDLVTLCEAGLAGRLHTLQAQWDPRPALGVVLAAGGYPDEVRRGDEITGLEFAARLPGKIFHAGTQLRDGRVVTNGGRVLCAVGVGADIEKARNQAYGLADAVQFSGAHYRRDIGHRALKR